MMTFLLVQVIVYTVLSFDWTYGQTPTDITCDDPPVEHQARIEHGKHAIYKPGHKLCYVCNEGLVNVGPPVGIIECLPESAWTKLDLECDLPEGPIEGKPVMPNREVQVQTESPEYFINNCGPPPTQEPDLLCPPPEELEGTVVVHVAEAGEMDTITKFPEGSYPPGSKATYKCLEGNRDKDTKGIVSYCQRNGTWSSVDISCKKPDSSECGKLPVISHGSFSYDNNTGRFIFACEDGYDIVGLDWIICHDGEWTGGLPYCSSKPNPTESGDHINPSDCGEVPSILHGSSHYDNITERYIFTCEDNYDIVGLDWIKCEEQHWTAEPPICDPVRCPDPGVPGQGRRIGNSFGFEDTVFYVCYSGYKLYGSQTRTCQRNRKWTGAPVTCDSGDHFCPVPVVPDGGMQNGFDYNEGDQISFTCEAGSVLYGSPVRTCLRNRKWSGKQPYCDTPLSRDTNDEIRQRLDNILTHLQLKSHLGINIYFVIDASNSIEDTEFRKIVRFAAHIVGELGVHPRSAVGAAFGAMTFASNTSMIFHTTGCVSTEQCQRTVKAIQRVHHEYRGTNLKRALIQVKKMTMHTKRRQPSSRSSSQNVVILFSDGMHNEGGNPIQAAEILKEREVEIFAVSMKTRNHPLNMKSKLAALASKPTKQHVVFPTGFNWDHILDYTKCGNPGHSANVSDDAKAVLSLPGAWPWVAQLYVHIPQTNQYEMMCAAALVDPLHLIASAACLQGMSEGKLPKVKFVSVDGVEDARGERRNVVQILPRERARGVDLIKLTLDRPVALNRDVMTVCLPSQEISSGHGVVLGWCFENSTSLAKLYQAQMKFTSRNICERPKSRGPTDHRFCIGPQSDQVHGEQCGMLCAGGNLVVEEIVDPVTRKGHWELAGITGAGAICGLTSPVGAYTYHTLGSLRIPRVETDDYFVKN